MNGTAPHYPLELISEPGEFRLRCGAVLFDMDGVLVDSSEQMDLAIRRWADEVGVTLASGERRHRSMTEHDFVRVVAPWLDADTQARRIRDLEHGLAWRSRPMCGAVELYEQVPTARRAVVTNGSRRVALARLTSSRIPVPDVLVTADDVRCGKPAPDPYLAAARQVGNGLPVPVVAIEDSVTGVRSARAAGITVVAVISSESSGSSRLAAETDYAVRSLEHLTCVPSRTLGA